MFAELQHSDSANRVSNLTRYTTLDQCKVDISKNLFGSIEIEILNPNSQVFSKWSHPEKQGFVLI